MRIRDAVRKLTGRDLSLLSRRSLTDGLSSYRCDQSYRIVSEPSVEFDYRLIDAAPITLYTDVFALGKLADGAILVLKANATHRSSLRLRVAWAAFAVLATNSLFGFSLSDDRYRRLRKEIKPHPVTTRASGGSLLSPQDFADL